jgi:predicted anti-sigma-YlaC factor YlaD
MTNEIKKLTCRATTYLVISARDTPLSQHQLTQLDAHLDTCSACRTAKQQFSDVFSQLDQLLARD